jgi:small multidrug resistance pump
MKTHPPMRKWLTLAAAIGSEVAATLALKAALDHPGWYVLVVAGYLAAFAFLAVCLRLGIKIGVAYGIWGAGGVVVTAVLSALIYGEPLTALMGLGIVLIIAGVLTVELGSQRAAREHEAPA